MDRTGAGDARGARVAYQSTCFGGGTSGGDIAEMAMAGMSKTCPTSGAIALVTTRVYVTSVTQHAPQQPNFSPQENKIQASKETSRKVIDAILERDRPADQAAADAGLMQSSDTGEIDAAIEKMIASNPKPLQQYRQGKQAAFGALIGMVMKQAKGLNPKLVGERLREKLS